MQMTNMQSSNTAANADSDNGSSTTVKLARKSTILSLVALITSEMTLICIALTKIPQIWLPLDGAINSWCIMLIFYQHAAIYDKMCCGCNKTVSIKCLACYSCNC